jgi:hypothetical protein
MTQAAQRSEGRELPIDQGPFNRWTHYLFRFPAKFHPPVARALLERFSQRGDRIYDPFCGSGTLLVEGAVSERRSVGSDVDPLAAFISQVKTNPIDGDALGHTNELLNERLAIEFRSERDYERLQWKDISSTAFQRELRDLWVPEIPNLFHWFRRYVIVDLARILAAIEDTLMPPQHRSFFRLCAASIIRNASNADPVPVSGLEVTSHMKRKDADGRVINPFLLFQRASCRAIRDMDTYAQAVKRSKSPRVVTADATNLRGAVRGPVDAVITSPPYHGAVDYYRRHQLEMFWLGLTATHDERLTLLERYIGRGEVPNKHPLLKAEVDLPDDWKRLEDSMRAVNRQRANAFRHYCVSLHLSLQQLSRVIRADAPVVMVVGHSKWNGVAIDTSELFQEIAAPDFELSEYFSYPVRNRYMSYARRNGANIDREYVLVLRRVSGKSNGQLTSEVHSRADRDTAIAR